MISSYPYPPEFLDWMKQLFKNPKPFINEVIKKYFIVLIYFKNTIIY